MKKVQEDSSLTPYSILKGNLNAQEKVHGKKRLQIQNALDLWNRIVPEHKISLIQEVQKMVNNPSEYYTALRTSDDQVRTDKLKEILGSVFDFKKFAESAIAYPEFFSELCQLCARVDRPRWDLFTIEDGEVQLSARFYETQINKTVFIAVTPLQKKLLAHAQRGIEWLKEKDELIRLQAEEEGIEPSKIQRWIDRLDHIGVLPQGIRVDLKYDGFNLTQKIYQVDENFVTHGFYEVVRSLRARLLPISKPNDLSLRICKVSEMDGSFSTRVINDGSDVPMDPLRKNATVLLPDVYTIHDGHLKKTGKIGKIYPDHPLIKQPKGMQPA
jgi:hypothetical protein